MFLDLFTELFDQVFNIFLLLQLEIPNTVFFIKIRSDACTLASLVGLMESLSFAGLEEVTEQAAKIMVNITISPVVYAQIDKPLFQSFQ